MTVSTQVSRNEYTGNGATTQYDFTFRILDKSHLLVQTLDTSESIVTLTLGTDYTVTGVNRYNGGKVVLTSALPTGYKISIERSTPVTQEASIRNQGGFFPEIHEDAFDKLTMLVQQAYGWWSGLSLRKPSWLANYYDALNNRIRNLRDPSQAQDAATKNYVDVEVSVEAAARQSADNNLQSQITANFPRTLRVPEASVSILPSVSGRKKKILAFNDQGNPICVLPESGSAADVLIELGSSEEGLGSWLVNGNAYFSVHEIIGRLTSYQDNGTAQPALGRDQTMNQTIYDSLSQLDLKHRGGLQLNKHCFGIRENATTLSVRSGTNSGSGFVPQVAGSDSIVTLARAGALDSVSIFTDNYLGPYLDAETIEVESYSATSFTVANESVLSAFNIGALVITRHSSPYVGLIKSISGRVVTVDMWCIYGTTTTGTPVNGTGLYLNPVTKGWAINANVLIDVNTRAQKCALAEFGLQNNGLSNTSLVTGVDSVVLEGLYGGGDGFRSRGTSAVARWNNAYSAHGGISTNFRSSTGQGACSLAAFYEESTSAIGLLFKGDNTSRSISCKHPTTGLETFGRAPWGHKIIDGSSFSTLSNGGTPTNTAYVWFLANSTAFSVVLPDPSNLTPGREFEFVLASTATVTFTNASGTVNGNPSYSITPSYSFSRVKAIYGGSNNWYITR